MSLVKMIPYKKVKSGFSLKLTKKNRYSTKFVSFYQVIKCYLGKIYFLERSLIMKKRLSYLTALMATLYVGVVALPIEIDPFGWCQVLGVFCP